MSERDPSNSDWFEAEVRPHEEALRAYLHARFATLGDIDDVVQEAFARLLRARELGQVRCAKALLFTTARNAALDTFRRRRASRTDALTDTVDSQLVEDLPDAAEVASRRQELDILAEAVRSLPDRCREVMLLRYRDGMNCKEIAFRLSLSPETVKVHLARGMRRCAEYFAHRGLLASPKNNEVAS
jgi:RNA polymerase sigma-70 factor (ECF subfamily)